MKKHERHNHDKKRDTSAETARIITMPTTKDELLDLLIGASKSTSPRAEEAPAYANQDQNKKVVSIPVDVYEDTRNFIYDDPSDYYASTNEVECVKNISYIIDPYVSANEYDTDDTAMTDVSQRGQIIYGTDCDKLFDAMPARCKYAIDVERRNNTTVIDTIMALEDECAQRKHELDMEYRRRIYETMFEFNTQCRTHRDAVNMCVIVDTVKQTSGNK